MGATSCPAAYSPALPRPARSPDRPKIDERGGHRAAETAHLVIVPVMREVYREYSPDAHLSWLQTRPPLGSGIW
jgi:hypothetical protein